MSSAAGPVIFFISLLGLLAILALWFGTYFGHSFLTVLEQTAAGSDDVEWPDEPFVDWLVQGVHFWGLAAFWPAVLWSVFRSLPGGFSLTAQVALYGLALWLLFPVSLLSSLSAASPFAVLRWQVLRQAARRPDAFATFLLVSPVFPVSVALANYGMIFERGALPAQRATSALLFGLPLVALGSVVFLLIYARLIGQLCWIIRPPVVPRSIVRPERLPVSGSQSDDEEVDEPESEDDPQQATPPDKSWVRLLHPSVFFFPLYERCRGHVFWLTVGWGSILLLIIGAKALYQNSIAPGFEAPAEEARSFLER